MLDTHATLQKFYHELFLERLGGGQILFWLSRGVALPDVTLLNKTSVLWMYGKGHYGAGTVKKGTRVLWVTVIKKKLHLED